MESKLLILGDSFAMPSVDESFYGNIIKDTYPDLSMIWCGAPSRDTQTVIDIWIKTIPSIREKDYLIVVIPDFSRTRLPLTKRDWVVAPMSWGSEITDRFIGTNSYIEGTEVESFGNRITRSQYSEILEPQRIINSTKAYEENYFEIISSLKKLTKCKVYVFTWMEIECPEDIMDNKIRIKEKIGIWEGLKDLFSRGEGDISWKYDHHWSVNTHKAFADFIIGEFNLKEKFKTTKKMI